MKYRICLYIGGMSQGGIGKLMLNLMEEFLRKEIAVDLFLMRGDGEYIEQVPKEVRIFIENGSYFKRIAKFIGYLKREKPTVSISARQRQDIGNILGCVLSQSGTKPIVSVHTNVTVENQQQKGRNSNFIVKTCSRWLYKRVHKFIAVSNGVADDFSRRTGVDRSAIKVIYNPVYKPYREDPASPFNPQHREFLTTGQKYVIGVGRLTKQKDFKTLIQAFSRIEKESNLALVILGDGPMRHELEDEVSKLKLNGKVFLFGFVSDPLYYIKRAEIFVLSSRWEGFGNVIVEALGTGTPVVSTNCPSGPEEILMGGKYGRLVPVGAPGEMAQAIRETLNNPPSPQDLISRAETFEVERITSEYLHYIFK